MNALDFLPLEKAVGADTVNDLAQVLGVSRRHIMHWRSVGLTEDEARDLAGKAEVDPGEVWPELGGQPAKAAPADETGIVWCDPPGRSRTEGGVSVWIGRLAPLPERPGQWARVHVCESTKKAHGRATNIRKLAREGQLPAGRWQFVVRPLDDGTAGIWACYTEPAGES